MWFKNLRVYQLLKPFDLSEAQLSEQLRAHAFRPCGSQEAATLGWVSPIDVNSDTLAHELTGSVMLCARREERLLPSTVVNEALNEKVTALEEKETRRVGRKEKAELREDIVQQLLPKAFVRSQRTYAMVDKMQGWILVDASSANKAESIISLLRESLGSLPVRPVEVKIAPAHVLTEWLGQPARHADFTLLDQCELRDTGEDGGVVRCSKVDLESDDIQAHIQSGRQVEKLRMEWDERLAFTLESDLALKRIKYLDLLQEQVADTQTEDQIALFDTIFSLMSLEFRRLIPRLLELFGGLETAK